MKKLKYKIRAALVRFFLKCCELLKGHCYCTNHFYYEEKYIKIKDLKNGTEQETNRFANIPMKDLLLENIRAPYKVSTWQELYDSVKRHGLKVNPKVVQSKYGYELYDGNHRIKILEHLYGKDYKIKVDIYLVHKNIIPYYTTMGRTEDLEFKKSMIRNELTKTEKKLYGPK